MSYNDNYNIKNGYNEVVYMERSSPNRYMFKGETFSFLDKIKFFLKVRAFPLPTMVIDN